MMMQSELRCLFADGSVSDVEIKYYPGGEPLIEAGRGGGVLRILLRPRSLGSFMAGLFWVDALASRGFAIPPLVLPCVPGARQDRLNDEGDSLFTAKSVAKEINARHFPSVTVLDPHSDVTPALIDRCKVIAAAACIESYASGYVAVVSPDGGAEKRAGAVARRLHLPLLHGWKTRDIATGAISGFGIETRGRPSGRVLVVDDICDGGGTFVGLADELDRIGLAADLFVTHGIFSKGTAPLLARFRRVFTTDSVLSEKQGADVAHICERLLKGDTK